MQAVLLAAGKSTRTYPLTINRPKPILQLANKTIIEHILDELVGTVSEAIIVVGYKKDMIKKVLKTKYKSIKISYVEQKQQKGTGHALLCAEKKIKGPFLMLAADDLQKKSDIKKLAKKKYGLLAAHVKDQRQFGVPITKNNKLVDFIEKPPQKKPNYVNCSCYKLDKSIFSYLKTTKKSVRGEVELPEAIAALAKTEDVHVIKTKFWLPIVTAWDVLHTDLKLRKKTSTGTKSTVTGKIINSRIGNSCIVEGNVKNSIILDHTYISKDSVVEYSIIGPNTYFDGRAKAKKNVTIKIKSKPSTISHAGTIIADSVIAKNVKIKSGVMVWPKKSIKGTITKNRE